MATPKDLYKSYRFNGKNIITREDFENHDQIVEWMKIPKPIRVYKEYAPKDESMECMISSKGIVNGQMILKTEYFDITHHKQIYYMRTFEYREDEDEEDGKYIIDTLYNRNKEIISQEIHKTNSGRTICLI